MDEPAYECYLQRVRKLFEQRALQGEDIYRIAKALQHLQSCYGADQCWDIVSIRHLEKGFTCSHQYIPRYKGHNASPLILAIYNIFPDLETGNISVIRKSICNDYHCINPRHIFYGDKIDLRIEKWRRNGVDIDKYKFGQILWQYKKDKEKTSYSQLAKDFNLSYNTVRSICGYENN